MTDILVATHKDVEDVLELTPLFWEEHYYSEYGDYNEQNTRMALHQMVDGALSTLLVARDNDELVGYIAFIVAPVIWGDLRSAAETLWWVAPDHRGKGIGKELLAAGMEWAEIMECDLLEAHDHERKRIHLCVGKS